jgi:hypothetical protein
MKRKITFLITFIIMSTQAFSQFDSICQIVAGQEIQDLVVKGNTMYAAMGTDGIFKSTDYGYNWTACAALPNAYTGNETAHSILIASNGDLIVGANAEYSFVGPPLSLSGIVYRSQDNGSSWTSELIPEMNGTSYAGKIIELSGGKLFMQAGFQDFYTSTLTDTLWTKVTALGGNVNGFMNVNDTIIAINSGSNAGLWFTANYGLSWSKYGSDTATIGAGTNGISPMVQAGGYKFIGNSGQYSDEGIWRSALHDTIWSLKYDVGANSFYPYSLATDNQSLWLVYYSHSGNQCYFTSSSDMGDSWTNPIGNIPMDSIVSAGCMEKLLPFGNDIYSYTNGTLWRMSGVANSIEENLNPLKASIFPNPNSGKALKVNLNTTEFPVTIFISDIKGSIVIPSKEYTSKEINIDLPDLSNGIYIINLTSKNKTASKKLIISK